MEMTAAVLTMSDKGFQGLRQDTSGSAICQMLEAAGYQIVHRDLLPGAFAENILTEGICLYMLPVGTRLRIGRALTEVTQIGKECHSDCAIRKAAGDCVMPREGIFVRVLTGSTVKAGNPIVVEQIQQNS